MALEASQLIITYQIKVKAHFPGKDLNSQMEKRNNQQQVILATIHINWIEGR